MNSHLGRPRPHADAHGPPLTHGAVEAEAPPSKPPLACVLHPSDCHLCRGAASQSWSLRPPASVRPRWLSKAPSPNRSSSSISIFRVSGRLVWPRWRASERVYDAQWRVWRLSDCSAGRGRAHPTRADDHGAPGSGQDGPSDACGPGWCTRR